MRAHLVIECIGHDQKQRLALYKGIIREALGQSIASAFLGNFPSRFGVRRITGLSHRGSIQSQSIQPLYDYSGANSVGSRGVMAHYHLEEGTYAVKAPVSWRKSDEYFCQIKDGEIYRISKEEVLEWLKDRSESASYRPPKSE